MADGPPPGKVSAGREFYSAAARFISAIEAGDHDAVASDDYRLALKTLTRFAQSWGRLPVQDAEEVAAETLAQAYERATDETGSEIRQPSAYLFWTVRNRIRDRYRRARTLDARELLVNDLEQTLPAHAYSSEDDAIAQLLDHDATAELLEDALRAAAAAEDRLLIRVVAAWLELAEGLDRAPSSREVEREADVSHTSVNQALRRLRNYFPPAGDPRLP